MVVPSNSDGRMLIADLMTIIDKLFSVNKLIVLGDPLLGDPMNAVEVRDHLQTIYFNYRELIRVLFNKDALELALDLRSMVNDYHRRLPASSTMGPPR